MTWRPLLPRATRVRLPLVLVAALAAAAPRAIADCDTTQPAMTGFGAVPSSVDVTNGPATVTCTIDVRDEQSGASSATCTLVSPSSTQIASCTDDVPKSAIYDDPVTSYFRCAVTIPAHAESGTWNVHSVKVADAVGNTAEYSAFIAGDPWPPGVPTAIAVADATPDLSPPAISATTLQPVAVDVTNAPADVTCSMQVTDGVAGVDSATCLLSAPPLPPPQQPQNASCRATAPSSGTRRNGVFSCTLAIPRYAASGTWTVVGATATDLAGNVSQALPQPAQLAVNDLTPDLAPPTVVGFSFQPPSVDTTAAPRRVTCNVHATDALAGVSGVACQFSSPIIAPQQQQQTATCTTRVPDSGTPNDGLYSCELELPMLAAGGAWTPVALVLDAAGNSTTAIGGGALAVACAGPYEVRITVTAGAVYWPPPSSATTYHVYRGDLPGLPGDGWGACLGETTSWQMADPALPAGAHGFYYLVDYVSGSTEAGLGMTSDGTPRTPQSACP